MSGALDAPGVSLDTNQLIALRRIALTADPSPVLAALPGGFATRRKGHGLEVADTREYVAGDDMRHLDRGTTARTGRLHVRQFQEERDRVVLLIADFRPSMFWGVTRAFRSVAAAEALVLYGWTVVEEGGRAGLLAITPGAPVIVPPRGRVRGMLDVIGGLVAAHARGLELVVAGEAAEPPLDVALNQVDRLAPAGAELVLASGFDTPGDGLSDRIAALARRRTPRPILITAAEGGALPRGRYPIRLPDGRRVRVTLDGAGQGAGAPVREVAGRSALVIDAGQPVEAMARQIAAVSATELAA